MSLSNNPNSGEENVADAICKKLRQWGRQLLVSPIGESFASLPTYLLLIKPVADRLQALSQQKDGGSHLNYSALEEESYAFSITLEIFSRAVERRDVAVVSDIVSLDLPQAIARLQKLGFLA